MMVNLLQLGYVLGSLCSLPLMPIVYWQGKKVRQGIPKMYAASGHPHGTTVGKQPAFKLLALGESSISGVGIKFFNEGLAARMSEHISSVTNQSVSWSVIAKNGLTATQVTEYLVPKIPADQSFDLIIIGLGGNDTFKLNSPRQWKKDCILLINAIRKIQPDCAIVFTNMPPVGQFPAFPKTMQQVLGSLTKLLGMAIEDLPDKYEKVYYNKQEIKLEDWETHLSMGGTVNDFFTDGIHPSALTYDIWGKNLADFVIDKKLVE